MDHDDWAAIVHHVRTELHRYYPDCPIKDIGVSMNRAISRGLVLTVSPDNGKTIITLYQTNAQESDAEFLTFRLPSRRVLTLPFPS